MLETKNRRQLKKLLEDKTLRVIERNIGDNGTYFKEVSDGFREFLISQIKGLDVTYYENGKQHFKHGYTYYYIEENLRRQTVLNRFLGVQNPKVPYIIGIAGSVAVGKSTSARILQSLLSHWPNERKVDLITTDGFLHPLQKLKQDNLLHKKEKQDLQTTLWDSHLLQKVQFLMRQQILQE